MNPTDIFDLAQTTLDCVCDQMDALVDEVAGYPGCPCLRYVSAGEPSIDCCVNGCDEADGMLTVHVEGVYASPSFPDPPESFAPCQASAWVASVVVTASRCAPTMDEEGNPAPMADLTASALVQSVDTYAILTALGCCVSADAVAGKRKRRVAITGMTPLVSDGGCASVEVRAAVEIAIVCGCPEGS